MKEYKGYSYPTLIEALEFYKVPSDNGGFNKNERSSKDLLIKLPIGVIVAVTGVDKDNLLDLYETDGDIIDEDLKRLVEDRIDNVCTNLYDCIENGDIDI